MQVGEDMILNKVCINNFKGIEACTIDLKRGFNLLIGDNGYGKTSILEAISVGLGGFVAGIEEVSTKHLLKEQGYLCGYCMRRLQNCADTKIEHIVPQSFLKENEKETLNYLRYGYAKVSFRFQNCRSSKSDCRK